MVNSMSTTAAARPLDLPLHRVWSPQDSGYRGRGDESAYLAAPSSSVGGRAASPDPKGVSRARSSSPGVAAAVSGTALPHQSLEHAMQTKLNIGEDYLYIG